MEPSAHVRSNAGKQFLFRSKKGFANDADKADPGKLI